MSPRQVRAHDVSYWSRFHRKLFVEGCLLKHLILQRRGWSSDWPKLTLEVGVTSTGRLEHFPPDLSPWRAGHR